MWSSFCESYRQNGLRRIAGLGNSHDEHSSVNAYDGAMQPVTAAKVKYGIWGLILGAVITMIVGFAWGGWRTMGAAQTVTDEAVLASRAAICVAQFMDLREGTCDIRQELPTSHER